MRTVFLAPNEEMFIAARTVLEHSHPDIAVKRGLLSEGVSVARSLADEGVEIIITRGGTASAIKEAGIEISIVEVSITGFDVIRTVEKARAFGSKVAVVAFPSMVMGIECLGPILGVDLRQYIIKSEFEAEANVLKAFADGADVVVGGVITAKTAKLHGYPGILIDSGAEGILQAAQEAKRVAYARQLEKVKAGLFKNVIDYAHEGVIAIDSEERITVFNPVAERITGIEGNKAIGQRISNLWPEFRLGQVMRSGKDDLGHLMRIRGKRILCNKVPIMVNNQPAGAVANFQDVSKIQQMEARIRQAIYASGHVASFTFDDVLGSAPAIQNAMRIAKEFALTQSAVLILGETGSGKEVFAQSIHNYSKRSSGPFVAINCAALPSQILESELFGYVGGAFTGANKVGKLGLFEVAHGGTIFLDEIGEMDYIIQGKLLRVLQEKKVVRLGSDKVIPVDVRIIAATNKNLKQLVADNRFRADLYYRLNVLRLRIPPLRERPGDIALYARHFLQKHGADRQLAFTEAALDMLSRHPWPGNVRELQNTVERIAVVCPSTIVDTETVIEQMSDEQESYEPAPLWDGEVDEIRQALAQSKGKYNEAAKLLGISRSTLWRKLRRLGLK